MDHGPEITFNSDNDMAEENFWTLFQAIRDCDANLFAE